MKTLLYKKLLASGFTIAFLCMPLFAAAITSGTTQAILTVKNSWGSGYCAQVDIAAGRAAVTNWTLTLNLSGAQISNLWGGTLTSGTVITPLAHNKNIAANSAINFGFCATGSGTPSISAFTATSAGSVSSATSNNTSSAPIASSSPASSVVSSSKSSFNLSSSVTASGQQCNWYGTLYPLCITTPSGWGYENNKSCIARVTCAAQPSPYGVVGNSAAASSTSSISSSTSSSIIVSSKSSSRTSSSSSKISSRSSSVRSSSSSSSSKSFSLVFRDDFNSFNSSRWQLMTHSWGGNLALFSANTVSVNNGMMKIELNPAPPGTQVDGETKPYLGAEVRSVDTVNYGRVSARAKLAKGSAVISALVTIYTPWPADNWNEFDIESLGKNPNQIQFNAMVYTGPKLTPPVTASVTPTQYPSLQQLGFDSSQDFHIYTIEWTPQGATFLIDGIVYHRWMDRTDLIGLPQNVLLTIWASNASGWAGPVTSDTVNAEAFYDWIEVWKYNP